MTTTFDLIQETRAHLMTGKQDKVNLLAANIGSSAGSLTLQFAHPYIHEGSVLAIGLELFLVVASSGHAPGSTITVIPAYEGSPTTSHLLGDTVRFNPQFSDWAIYKALDNCIKSLAGEGLYYIKSLEIDYSPSVSGYPFTATDYLQPWSLRYDTPGSDNSWPQVNATDYRIDIHANTTDFPSGNQLVIRFSAAAGFPLRFSYKARFGSLDPGNLNLDISTLGLHNEGMEIPPLGAAIRLMAGREIKRNFTVAQPEGRRSSEVPPGAVAASMNPIIKRYYDALDNYRLFLHRLYRQRI